MDVDGGRFNPVRFRMPVDEGTAGEVWGLKLLLVFLPAMLIMLPFKQAPWWVYVMVVAMWIISVGLLLVHRWVQDRARRKRRGIW